MQLGLQWRLYACDNMAKSTRLKKRLVTRRSNDQRAAGSADLEVTICYESSNLSIRRSVSQKLLKARQRDRDCVEFRAWGVLGYTEDNPDDV